MKIAGILKSALVDGSILAGAGLLAYGAWLAFPPAGFLVAGALLLAGGLRGATR